MDAGSAAGPADLRLVFQSQVLIYAKTKRLWFLAIIRSYRTGHNVVSVHATLELMFGVHQDIGNALREHILHQLLSSHSTEETLDATIRMVDQLIGRRGNQ